MNCLQITASSDSPYSSSQARCLCGFRVALATIAACGLAVSICAIVSYLPPSAGYCGGVACILSLITLAICSVNSRRNYISIIDNPLIDRTNILSDHHTNPNIQNDDQIKHATHTVQRANILPDELYITIFSELNGEDLARASQVCKRWNQVAEDDRLWKSLCFQEVISPQEGLLVPTNSYKDTYCNSKALLYRIRNNTPQESLMKIPEDVCTFLKTNNLFFLYTESWCKGGKVVEIWDSSLHIQYLKKSIWDVAPGEVEIKINGQTAYLIRRVRGTAYPSNVHIYLFDIVTRRILTPIRFLHPKGAITNTACEVIKDRVFMGQKDGGIVIWDLKQKGSFPGPDVIDYDATSQWSEKNEKTWQATYDKEQMEEIKKKWTYHDHCLFKTSKMEAGEFERSSLSRYREYHQMLQNRIWLRGHTKEITSLCAAGSFLFSASQDGTIRQWDWSTGKCIQTIDTGFEYGVISLQVAGQYVFGLSVGLKTRVCQWNFATGEYLLHDLKIALNEGCHSFNIVGNLLFCLCTSEDHKQFVKIYNLSTKEFIQIPTAQSSHHKHMQIENNCLYILVNDGILKWDFAPPK